MARPLLLVAVLAPLALGAAILSAKAQTAAPTAPADPAIVDLQTIPVQPVTGPLSVKGIAGDDEDEGAVLGRSRGHHGDEAREAETENQSAESDSDMDD